MEQDDKPPHIQFVVNGQQVVITAEATTPLLYVLRNELDLKAAKFGCGQGLCGACVVVVDGHPLPSCDTPLWAVSGKAVTTVEGLASREGVLHPLQSAFIDCQALQCGYCTPGILMRAATLLLNDVRPSRDVICNALSRHLCRCGAHNRIIAAIQTAGDRIAGLAEEKGRNAS
jgi:nicotinate dehydrogenase subunit A